MHTRARAHGGGPGRIGRLPVRGAAACCASTMEALYALPFRLVLRAPRLRLKLPRVSMPSAMAVFAVVLAFYFLFTAGIIYDIVMEPPSIGQSLDERGRPKPVAIMQYRLNGQYIMEGLAAAFMFILGAVGFILLDRATTAKDLSRLQRTILASVSVAFVLISLVATRTFIRIKMPSYLAE